MVRVESLSGMNLSPLTQAGFRERPEEWNRAEVLGTTTHPKRVFAPPVGDRSINIHVREAHSETARYALLFRDFLRANDDHRDTWGSIQAAPRRGTPGHLHLWAGEGHRATAPDGSRRTVGNGEGVAALIRAALTCRDPLAPADERTTASG